MIPEYTPDEANRQLGQKSFQILGLGMEVGTVWQMKTHTKLNRDRASVPIAPSLPQLLECVQQPSREAQPTSPILFAGKPPVTTNL